MDNCRSVPLEALKVNETACTHMMDLVALAAHRINYLWQMQDSCGQFSNREVYVLVLMMTHWEVERTGQESMGGMEIGDVKIYSNRTQIILSLKGIIFPFNPLKNLKDDISYWSGQRKSAPCLHKNG
ncbi:hypothetical protein SAY86_012309 [Trapa natans]|uniref:Uncharacterized protein n=1 Tax=Trapa natans TaxID=22666 RepID=A0AAN7RAI5_TRANT|nr:hypothetical protein SAY86_012309 [Trapa natans]